MLPALPGASDHVTDLFAVNVKVFPTDVARAEGVIAGPLPAAAVVPVPDKLTVCGEPVPLSVMVRVAVSLAVVDGAKVTATVQVVPTETELQLLV